MDDFEGFNTLEEDLIADVVKIVRKLELEVEPNNVTALLQCHDKTISMRSCLLWISKESGFL